MVLDMWGMKERQDFEKTRLSDLVSRLENDGTNRHCWVFLVSQLVCDSSSHSLKGTSDPLAYSSREILFHS